MTIHELADSSGVSVKTLHYYDRINLLKPCCIEQNGYRKYNEASLKRLQQILFYKEMDMPLKTIKTIMNQPTFDPKTAIHDQKDLLIAKRNRLNKMIELMEQILEGTNSMDFSVFQHNELEEVMRNRFEQMDEGYRQSFINYYGSINAFIEQMRNHISRIDEQAIKYYGSMDNYIESLRNAPLPPEGMGKLQLKLDDIVKQITAKRGEDVSSPEVQRFVDEWKETAKKLFQMDDITEVFRQLYQNYQDKDIIIKANDSIYGEGSSVYLGKAMEYNDKHTLTT